MQVEMETEQELLKWPRQESNLPARTNARSDGDLERRKLLCYHLLVASLLRRNRRQAAVLKFFSASMDGSFLSKASK